MTIFLFSFFVLNHTIHIFVTFSYSFHSIFQFFAINFSPISAILCSAQIFQNTKKCQISFQFGKFANSIRYLGKVLRFLLRNSFQILSMSAHARILNNPGSVIGPRKKTHIQRPLMDFLVEGLGLFQKNLSGHFRTVEIPQYPRFSPIGVPKNALLAEFQNIVT